MEHHIVIIGAGPRGTYCLRRVLLHLEKNLLKHPVNVHVIEKSGKFGGGGVHSVTQPSYLLLNTIGSQITAFGDEDTVARESEARKTLHGYLAGNGVDIGPNDYPSRAQHGEYLAEMFDWAQQQAPPGVTVHRHAAEAVDIEPGNENGKHRVILESGESLPAHEILLLTGHAKNRIVPGSLADACAKFSAAQQENGKQISYLHLVYPISKNTDYIQPDDTVYVIGMGLTAVDVVKTFTIGRGGRFTKNGYIPSGDEPFIILGSRLGIPYSARGHNQKEGQYKAKIMTPDRVLAIKKQKDKINFETDLLPLIVSEMSYVYYNTLMGKSFGDKLLSCSSDEERCELIAENVPETQRFSWKDLENPWRRLEASKKEGQPLFNSLEDYTRFVVDYLRKDIAEAERGNLMSPLKNAVDSVMRDLRDTLRLVVDKGGLTAESHRSFDRVFSRINNRVAVGPPASSTKELMMLAAQGLLSFSGPNPRLEMDENRGEFSIESDRVAGSKRFCQHVLNGRIHIVDNKNDTSSLIQNLYARKLIRNFVNADETGSYELGGLDVTDEFNIIGADGTSHPDICALGIPIEGKFWFNAADARPDVNSNAIGQLSRWAAAAVSKLQMRESS